MTIHTCHWPGCEVEVPPSMWGCKEHWMRLPKFLRGQIWRTYRIGQEVRRDPSPEYIEAAAKVRDWILKNNLGVKRPAVAEVRAAQTG